jgi:hypothetical protein
MNTARMVHSKVVSKFSNPQCPRCSPVEASMSCGP